MNSLETLDKIKNNNFGNNKTNKFLRIFFATICIIAIVIYSITLINGVLKSSGSLSIIDDLKVEYNTETYATNQFTILDSSSVIDKLSSANNLSIENAKISLNIDDSFKFNNDITLSGNEFCALLNLVNENMYSSENQSSFYKIIETDIDTSKSNTTSLTLYYSISASSFSSFIGDTKDIPDILLINNNSKFTNSNLNINIETLQINSYTQETATANISSAFFNEDVAFSPLDSLLENMKDIFNCDYTFIDNQFKIIA